MECNRLFNFWLFIHAIVLGDFLVRHVIIMITITLKELKELGRMHKQLTITLEEAKELGRVHN